MSLVVPPLLHSFVYATGLLFDDKKKDGLQLMHTNFRAQAIFIIIMTEMNNNNKKNYFERVRL